MALAPTVEDKTANHHWLVCTGRGAVGDGALGAAGLRRLAAVDCGGTFVVGAAAEPLHTEKLTQPKTAAPW